MLPPRHPSLRYQPALDGLRGITILCLLVFHAESTWLTCGYLAVSTFFTLSGFLITSLLLVEKDATGRIDLAHFWTRRLRRLMPAAVLGVVLATVLALLSASQSQLSRLFWDGIGALFYFANFRFMATGHSYWEMFSRPSPLQHYWSLSIEEQFYLVYPLLLLGVSALLGRERRRLRAILVALGLVSTALMVSLSLAGVATGRVYYGTDTRAAEFLAGAVLATLLVDAGDVRPWRGRGFALATAACVAFVVAAVALVEEDSSFLYHGGFALYAIATAVVINASLAPGAVQTFLLLRPLRWLGRVSYGTYVYHWPIYLFLDTERTGLEGVQLLVLQVAVTLLVATASYRWIEQPIRTRSRLSGGRAALAFPLAATAVVALLLVTRPAAPDPAARDWTTVRMPELGPPAPLGPLRVMILGDSVGWGVGNGFRQWSARHPGRVTTWNLAQVGCGLLRDPAQVRSGRSAYNPCARWPEFWEEKVELFRPDLVVIVAGVWDLRALRFADWNEARAPGDPEYDALLLAEYRLAVDIASSRGAHVVWINAPCIGPLTEKSPLSRSGAFDPSRVEHMNQAILPALLASRPRQVELFDLYALVCPNGHYVKSLDGIVPTRWDAIHLSAPEAFDVASRIADGRIPEASTATAGDGDAARAASP